MLKSKIASDVLNNVFMAIVCVVYVVLANHVLRTDHMITTTNRLTDDVITARATQLISL